MRMKGARVPIRRGLVLAVGLRPEAWNKCHGVGWLFGSDLGQPVGWGAWSNSGILRASAVAMMIEGGISPISCSSA